jgi:hypothetical protein
MATAASLRCFCTSVLNPAYCRCRLTDSPLCTLIKCSIPCVEQVSLEMATGVPVTLPRTVQQLRIGARMLHAAGVASRATTASDTLLCTLSAHALCAAGVAWIGGGRARHAASTGQQLRFGPKTTVATLERAARNACYRRRRILRRWRIYALRKLLLPQVPQSAAAVSMTWL